MAGKGINFSLAKPRLQKGTGPVYWSLFSSVCAYTRVLRYRAHTFAEKEEERPNSMRWRPNHWFVFIGRIGFVTNFHAVCSQTRELLRGKFPVKLRYCEPARERRILYNLATNRRFKLTPGQDGMVARHASWTTDFIRTSKNSSSSAKTQDFSSRPFSSKEPKYNYTRWHCEKIMAIRTELTSKLARLGVFLFGRLAASPSSSRSCSRYGPQNGRSRGNTVTSEEWFFRHFVVGKARFFQSPRDGTVYFGGLDCRGIAHGPRRFYGVTCGGLEATEVVR